MKKLLVHPNSVADVRAKLTEDGYSIYDFDTLNVFDRTSFFETALLSLPVGEFKLKTIIDPAWPAAGNWDAFLEFMGEELMELERRVGFIWNNSDELRRRVPVLYGYILSVIEGAARWAEEPVASSFVLILVCEDGDAAEKIESSNK